MRSWSKSRRYSILCYERYGAGFAEFINARVEVVAGDVSQPGLGLDAELSGLLRQNLDLVINSSGLTDFNPDLRDALSTNVDAAVNILDFVRKSDHAALLHLSTCYVAGARDGRVSERVRPNYTPAGILNFDAEQEWHALHEMISAVEQKAESPEVTEELRQQALSKEHAAKDLQGAALENQIRKNRVRWLKTYLTEAGTRRAHELGWPNTYTLTKSLAESLIHKHGAGLPIAVVRPAIVETSIEKPFLGWNEGINTSASLSYLLGTSFRQLPSNERKRLDIIPVDSVCAGMTLVAAALIERRNDAIYQLATSVTNPCDMGRSIELTSLGPPQALPGAGRPGVLAAAAAGRHPGFQAALPAHVRAGAESDHQVDSADHVAFAAAQAASGEGRTQSGKSGKADSAIRALHPAERA